MQSLGTEKETRNSIQLEKYGDAKGKQADTSLAVCSTWPWLFLSVFLQSICLLGHYFCNNYIQYHPGGIWWSHRVPYDSYIPYYPNGAHYSPVSSSGFSRVFHASTPHWCQDKLIVHIVKPYDMSTVLSSTTCPAGEI